VRDRRRCESRECNRDTRSSSRARGGIDIDKLAGLIAAAKNDFFSSRASLTLGRKSWRYPDVQQCLCGIADGDILALGIHSNLDRHINIGVFIDYHDRYRRHGHDGNAGIVHDMATKALLPRGMIRSVRIQFEHRGHIRAGFQSPASLRNACLTEASVITSASILLVCSASEPPLSRTALPL